MSEPENKDQQVIELISSKIAAEDADSGWVLAYATMRVLPVLKDIAAQLVAITESIAPDKKDSPSLAEELRSIARPLKELAELAKGEKR
jgi:hypothetical protein